MNDEREDRLDDETIDEEKLPREGNSNARLYPPVHGSGAPGEEGDKPDTREDDADQPAHGDASARREGGDQAAQQL